MTEAAVRKIFDDPVQASAGARIVSQLGVEYTPELRSKADVPGKHEITLLVVAMGALNKKAMRQLLAMGASPDRRSSGGESPMSLAAGAEDQEFLQVLLHAGGNPNLRKRGDEPISFVAVSQRRWKNLAILVDNGADLNATDVAGNTVLHYLGRLGEFGPIPALIERGANFRKGDRGGVTLGDLVLSSRVNPASPQGAARERVRELLVARGGMR